MRFLAVAVLAVGVLVAGCSSGTDASDEVLNARAVGPSEDAATAPFPIANRPVGAGELLPGGVGEVAFGETYDVALKSLIDRFGEPERDSGWYASCEEPALRVLWWPFGESYDEPFVQAEFHATIRADFQDDRTEFETEHVEGGIFVSYALIDTPFGDASFGGESLATPEGLSAGVSVSELTDIYGDVEFRRADDENSAVHTWTTARYHGWLSGDPADPTATVVSIVAGTDLTNRSC